MVTPIVVGIAAGGVNHNQTTGAARSEVEFHRAALQLKGAVNGVKDSPQSKIHLGLRRVEGQYCFLRAHR